MGNTPPALFNRGVSYDIGHTHPEKILKIISSEYAQKNYSK